MLRWLFVIVGLLFVSGLASGQEQPRLVVLTHDSFNVSEDVLAAFESETGIRVEILRSGDAGTLVNQAVLTRDNPLGDVLFGVDNTFLGRALEADLFVPYESPLLETVPDDFRLDPDNRVTPIDFGDVCLNYDAAYFDERGIALPDTLRDLTDPAYRSLLAVQNPATSSPGLAFLLTTIAAFGEEGEYTYLDFWRDLMANDVYIAEDWTDAYYNQFSGSAGSAGTRPLVVSYASSPPAEVFFADPPVETAPTGSIVADGMCFRQIEFVGILKGTTNLQAAQALVAFMLGLTFQEDMPLQMFVFPVQPEAVLPEVFQTYALIPEAPVMLPLEAIGAGRERWLQEWTETVLRS